MVARACKAIAVNVGKGALANVLGSAGTENVLGRDAEEASTSSPTDPDGGQRMGRPPRRHGEREMETFHEIPNRHPKGEYLLLFDPLDGSSNIDVNVSRSAPSFGVEVVRRTGAGDRETFLLPGTSQVAAGYAVYGRPRCWCLPSAPACIVHARPRDGLVGAHAVEPTIPEDTREFAINNMSNMRHWEPPVEATSTNCCRAKGRPARQGLQHALGRLDGG